MLIDAGSPVDWQSGEEPGDAILEIINGWRSSHSAAALLDRAPG